MHETNILHDLAWIMLAAAIAVIAFQKIKLPPLLGYIAAGFAIGPHLGLWPALVQIENVQELAELGVIFLMFYIGLEFDLDRLKKVFAPAFLALALQTLLMLFIGMEVSRWLGMSPTNGWFLGGLLSISSSMVSVKLIRERNVFHHPHGQMAVGILIFEDFLAIVLLVLLAGLAERGSMDYEALGRSALLIGIFVVAVFLIGKLGAPRLMNVIEKRGTTETVTMSTLGIIFLVSLLADAFHFSWALGGFLAGAILSRTRLAHKIDELTEPLRDLFSALFFVSVGMLIDPIGILNNAVTIIALSVIVIIAKFSSCWLGLFLAGQRPRVAGRAALIKSQIGEFSFVITAIGAKYAVTSPDLQAIASGVAFVTILTTPSLISNEDRILNFIERITPRAAKEFCTLFAKWEEALRSSLNRSSFLALARKPIERILIHFIIINAIMIAAAIISDKVEAPTWVPFSKVHFYQGVFVLSLLMSLPFIVDTVRNLNVLVLLFSKAALSRIASQQFSKKIYRAVFEGLILLLLLIVYGSVFIIVAAPYFPTGTVFATFLVSGVILGWIFWKKLIRMHNGWEKALVESISQNTEENISQRIEDNLKKLTAERPWDVKVESLQIPPDSRWVGCQIKDMDMRRQTGVFIAGIERGGYNLENIKPDSRLFPNDQVFLIGESTQINKAIDMLRTKAESAPSSNSSINFDRIPVVPNCPLIGLRLKDTKIRDDYHVTIVGIRKEERRIIGPSPDEIIEEGDILLSMGVPENLANFKEAMSQIAPLDHAEVG